MKFSYYPGCTLKTKGKELDIYGRKSLEALGVNFEELKEWQCCGAVYPVSKDEVATKLSAVRTLAQAKEEDGKLLTLCSACHHVIKRVNEDMKKDENLRLKANNYLALETTYYGETDVIHFLELLRDYVGFDKIKEKVVNPLKGVKIGAYYGCLLLRPSDALSFDNPENPTIIEDFIKAIGATPVTYAFRNECCGAYVSATNKEIAERKCANIINSANEQGAEMLVTACPLCMYNLTENGKKAMKVVYFTELLAEALGVKE
ncbi:MAG: CoB--CoM heterodisulfide reductase iron-sulfur subunit B family protein [Clostridia bacterium]|nr:CoB--CoM heterodisulfide reductase iron-sulfur subunit B family protein [Clostridia bacterium]